MKNFLSFRWLWNVTLCGTDEPAKPAVTETTPVYTPEERAARAQLFNYGSGIYNSQLGQYASLLQPSAATQAAQSGVLSTATGAGSDLAANTAGAVNFGTSGAVLDPNRNPGFQTSLDTAVRKVGETYTDPGGVLSNIRSNFQQSAPSGQSSREAIAMGQASKNYLNTVGDVTGKMTSDAYNKGLDYMSTSTALAPQSYSLLQQPNLDVGAVGAQQEAYNKAQFNAPWAELQPYMSMLQGFAGGAGTTTTATPATPSSSADNAQVLGTGIMIAAMIV